MGAIANVSCAILQGSVQCWGTNSGYSATLVPGSVADFVSFAPGPFHKCYVLADGAAYCWGSSNSAGQLGNGGTSSSPTPALVVGAADFTQLVTPSYSLTSDGFTCGVRRSGAVACWGSNNYGQLGMGTTDGVPHTTPGDVPGLSGVQEVALGWNHACARRSNGTVSCWGDNASGQLGVSGTSVRGPIEVPGITTAQRLVLGPSASCAILADATLTCWGANTSGQLGDGTRTSRSTPLTVPGLTGVVSAALGGSHACAVLTGGTIRCWGGGSAYQLGTGSTADQLWATTGPSLTGATSVAAGSSHTCALLADGTYWCWGYNNSGQCGTGSTTTYVTGPTRVAF